MVACGTDYEPEIDEFNIANLTPIPSKKIKPPILKESKIKFECILNQIVQIGNNEAGSGFVVIGEIILFHINDEIYKNGNLNLESFNPIGRLAGNWYSRPTNNFKIIRKIKPKK